MRLIVHNTYKCEYASVQELETTLNLERNYRKLYNCEVSEIKYMGKRVNLITDFDKNYENKFFKSSVEIDLNKLEQFIILDNPRCAKIEFGDAIIPGMLMTITNDGDYAPLVFFPMALCCVWSKIPNTDYYDINYDGIYQFYGHFFKWTERPFSQIFSLFRKGKRIAFSSVRNQESEYEPQYRADYIHVW